MKNKKTYFKQITALTLTAVMTCSATSFRSMAADQQVSDNSTVQATVTAQIASSWISSIPNTIEIDAGEQKGHYEVNSADAVSLELIEINQKRKDMTAYALFDIYAIIEHNHMENDYPLIVYKEDLHPGLVGLIAGNLSEKYRTNVFVFSKKENNILTGSGRGLSRLFHLKETLDCASDLLLGYGGHAQAAGLSLIEDNLDKFVSIMKTLAGEKPLCPRYYDFEANTEDIKQAIADTKDL